MIVATCLLGPDTASIVGPAIESIRGHADYLLLLENGGGTEAVLAAAEDWNRPGAWKALPIAVPTVLGYPNYRHLRNQALAHARGIPGAQWALTIDPDERVSIGLSQSGLRGTLDQKTWHAFSLASGQDYAKPRIMRLDCFVGWRGPSVHEELSAECSLLPGTFSELWAGHAADAAKWDRDVLVLSRYCEKYPDDNRAYSLLVRARCYQAGPSSSNAPGERRETELSKS